jgi:hypothetical protein
MNVEIGNKGPTVSFLGIHKSELFCSVESEANANDNKKHGHSFLFFFHSSPCAPHPGGITYIKGGGVGGGGGGVSI